MGKEILPATYSAFLQCQAEACLPSKQLRVWTSHMCHPSMHTTGYHARWEMMAAL